MPPRIHYFFVYIGVTALVALAIILVIGYKKPEVGFTSSSQTGATTTSQTASVLSSQQNQASTSPATSTASARVARTPKQKARISATIPPVVAKPETVFSTAPDNQARRIEHPYSSSPLSFDAVNGDARAALVNIVCAPSGGSLRPISASGVIIDPRGVILTNAHVAQYVLLSESSSIDLSCVIRTGSPARPVWTAQILYIPPVWVEEHSADIRIDHPTGTGEHDYALLVITGTPNGSSLPPSFPYLPVDTREAVGFVDDPALAASYPAEYVGALAAQNDLYPATSVTTIRDLLTFNTNTVDLVSLGGVIEAQSGSSGGAVVNAWDRVIGIITTTSEGTTTAQRDLRAITLSYINRDLSAQTGFNWATIFGGDVHAEAEKFRAAVVPRLLHLFLDQITQRPN